MSRTVEIDESAGVSERDPHEGDMVTNIAFSPKYDSVPSIHGQGCAVSVEYTEGGDKPALGIVGLALPGYIGGVFVRYSAEEMRNFANGVLRAADFIDKTNGTEQTTYFID